VAEIVRGDATARAGRVDVHRGIVAGFDSASRHSFATELDFDCLIRTCDCCLYVGENVVTHLFWFGR
jgi:hypothetical protein